MNLGPRDHVGFSEFKMLKMLPTEYRVEQLKLNHMFNIMNNLAPIYMSVGVSDRSRRATRNSQFSLNIPTYRTKTGQTTFLYSATKAWNALPSNIQASQNKYSFKKGVKQFLFDRLEAIDSNQFIYY